MNVVGSNPITRFSGQIVRLVKQTANEEAFAKARVAATRLAQMGRVLADAPIPEWPNGLLKELRLFRGQTRSTIAGNHHRKQNPNKACQQLQTTPWGLSDPVRDAAFSAAILFGSEADDGAHSKSARLVALLPALGSSMPRLLVRHPRFERRGG